MYYLKTLSISALLMIFSCSAFASGSDHTSKSNNADNIYNEGKTIVHKQLICESCPLEAATLDENTAMTIIEKLKTNSTGSDSLSASQKESVIVYLEKRFSMKMN